MEDAWLRAEARVRAFSPEEALRFGFDRNEMNLNIVCNGYNRTRFPKRDLWQSPRTSWHRAGLGVWDFLLRRAHDAPPRARALVTLVREEGGVRVELECEVVEAHLQVKEEVGDLSVGEAQVLSTVAGRALLTLKKLTVLSTAPA